MIRPTLTWVLLLTTCSLATALCAQRLRSADAAATSGAARLATARAQVEELTALAARAERVALDERPKQDVLASINGVLATCGIPSRSFRSLDVESDVSSSRAAPGAPERYRRQSLSLLLADLRPAQLGEFLAEWAGREAVWTPTRLELTHSRTAPQPGNYAARILLTATYLDD